MRVPRHTPTYRVARIDLELQNRPRDQEVLSLELSDRVVNRDRPMLDEELRRVSHGDDRAAGLQERRHRIEPCLSDPAAIDFGDDVEAIPLDDALPALMSEDDDIESICKRLGRDHASRPSLFE